MPATVERSKLRPMTSTNVVLAGFGRVGRAFVRLLREKRSYLRERYHLELKLQAVLRTRGGVMAAPTQGGLEPAGLEEDALERHDSWRPGLGLGDVLAHIEPGVLVECISAHPETGEPALSYLKSAMGRGWQAVTASKGPLAAEGRGLRETARALGVSFKFSGAVGAALPAADVGLQCLAGAEVEGIEGILNGTTNFILTGMREGRSYEKALAEAKRLGIAEPDPRRDVEGWDTAVKLLLLSNLIFDEDLKLAEVRVRGLPGLSAADLSRAAGEGKKVKLLGRARRRGGRTELGVGPETLEPGHPLFHVDGAEKGVTFITDSMGAVTVFGGKSDPRGAAAAMLKDIILIRYYPQSETGRPDEGPGKTSRRG